MRQELRTRIEALEAQLEAAHERYRSLTQQAQRVTLDIQRISGGLMALRELEHSLTDAHERDPEPGASSASSRHCDDGLGVS